MKSKIRVYVESLFDGALKTEQVVELREEILQNVVDKYDDLVADGRSEDEAYRIAVSGIGDINDLLRSMGSKSEEKEAFNPYENANNVRNSAVNNENVKTGLLCTGVVLLILSMVPLIAADELIGTDRAEGIAVCLMFIICAIGIAFIIAYAASRPKNANQNKTENIDKTEPNPVVKSINSAIWSVGTVIYFIVSFATGAWVITWLIFLITDAVTEVVKAYFDMKEE